MAVVPVTVEEASGTAPSLGPELPDVWQPRRDLRPLPTRAADEWTGGMSGNAFVGDQVLLDVSFGAARSQLRRLAADGVLLGASEYAYSAAITGLAQEGGPAAALSRLAGVEPADVVETRDRARLPLRWQAIGPDGALFPALDADLTLTPAGDQTTVLALAGVYRLPSQQTPAGLGPATVRCVAAVAIRSFIAGLACTLVHPAGVALQ